MPAEYHFELISIQKEEPNISSDMAMLYLLSANNHICDGSEKIDKEKNEVKLGDGTIVSVRSVPNSATPLNDYYFGAFHITILGKFNEVESLRIPIIKYLLQNKFTVFIVNDEISQEMTKELYPLINKVETALRSYLIKYFIKMYSTEFWDKIADKDMQVKLENTEKNLSVLKDKLGFQKNSKFEMSGLKLNMYGIEFSQLGRIVYGPRLGSVACLDDAIKLIKNSIELDDLKKEVFSFGDKFFKESFIDKGFQSKWEALTRIRHIVAHNNICLIEDAENGKKLASELIEIVEKAINEIDTSGDRLYDNITIGEDATDVEKPVVFMNESYKIISRQELLFELEISENFSRNSNGYVGLKWFVKSILYEKKSYAIGPCYTAVNKLEEEGKIEIYDYFDPERGYTVKAIRTKSKLE